MSGNRATTAAYGTLVVLVAVGIGIAAALLSSALREPTHNVGALFIDALAGLLGFVVALLGGGLLIRGKLREP